MRRLAARLAVLGAACVIAATLVALVTGRIGYVVTDGVSMNPLYHQGDLVVVTRVHSYHVGQIVAYHVANSHLVALHRIVGGTANSYLIKGDNNQSIDATHPAARELIGHAILHIPHGGLWLERLTNPAVLALLAFALIVGGGGASRRRRQRRSTVSRHARSVRSTRGWRGLPPAASAAAAITGILGFAGAALAIWAWSGPTDELTPSSGNTSRQASFSYTAHVPRTAAYDSTTVRSPDPVFRRLTNSLTVHLTYHGNPGTISIDASLATPTGWHTTVPLAPRETFTGHSHQVDLPLNLDTLQARAQAAAAATGLPSNPLTLTVTASVRTGQGTPFTPSVTFNLSPLELSLAGDPSSLTVRDTVPVTRLAPAHRRLDILGRHLAVATARTASIALLVTAVAGGMLIVLIALRASPPGEGAAIRRRYAPLLAPVEPLPTRPNLPTVDVADFAALAKIAEHAGLLVLHWSRSDIETFVVLDDAATYRYRTGTLNNPPAPAKNTADEQLQPQ